MSEWLFPLGVFLGVGAMAFAYRAMNSFEAKALRRLHWIERQPWYRQALIDGKTNGSERSEPAELLRDFRRDR